MKDACLVYTRAPTGGHSYRNSSKGEISADSINQRRFHFLLYLAESGRVYIGTQYLGNFGAYEPLRRTIIELFSGSQAIHSHTFRVETVDPSMISERN